MDELVGEQYEVACQQSQQVSEQTEQISQQSGVVGEQAEAFSQQPEALSQQSERLIFIPIWFGYILHIKSYHRTRFRVPDFLCVFGDGAKSKMFPAQIFLQYMPATESSIHNTNGHVIPTPSTKPGQGLGIHGCTAR